MSTASNKPTPGTWHQMQQTTLGPFSCFFSPGQSADMPNTITERKPDC